MKPFLLLLCAGAFGARLAGQDAAESAALASLARSLAPAAVRVEYHLQNDKGETPRGAGLMERCPRCGRVHINEAEELIREERPLEVGGFLLTAERVIARDPQIHPRFVKRIVVRAGAAAAEAQPAAYASRQPAVLLALKGPLAAAKPLEFKPDAKAPYYLVSYVEAGGEWTLGVEPLLPATAQREDGASFIVLPESGVIVDGTGAAVGASFTGELPADGSWKGAPLQWPLITAAEMAGHLAAVEQAASQCVLRVALSFRSPKATPTGRRYRSYGLDEEEMDESGTELNALGVVLPDNKLLVLAKLKPKVTARLQTITVFPPAGPAVTAKFEATLKDHGCLVAAVEKPLPGASALASTELLGLRHQWVFLGEIAVKGEKRIAHFHPAQISAFGPGAKQRLYPNFDEGVASSFIYDTARNLVALPVTRREKPSTERREYYVGNARITPVSYLTDAVRELAQNSDPANVPLDEAAENRLAWLGAELQPMNKELARANNVSDQTRNGESGALIAYVYPDSPAARAGLETGAILLRLRTPDQPNPLEVKLDDERMYFDAFPWDRLSEVPEDYFDRLPTPWAPVENSLTRLLTDLGFGTRYSAELIVNGQAVSKDLEVVASPPHYESADRYKAEALGITVRDLTYEVRRYLQKKPSEPGVVVSKIEPGSKAGVAGIRPYELITHINDEPLANVQDFKRLSSGTEELRLSVKRMAKGRIVTVRPGPGAAPGDKKDKPDNAPALGEK